MNKNKNNSLEFAIRLMKRRWSRLPIPLLVQFNVTNRCNARCNYCYASYYERESQDMPIESIKRIIDELSAYGTFRINLVGGEPLLRPDIDDIISYIKEKIWGCVMTTNGSLVPQHIDTLKKLDSICFSIDGNEEHNDLNRGIGSYKKAISGIEACKKAHIPIQFSAVLTKHTVNDVDFMVELAKHYECKIGFTTLISQDREGRTYENDLRANKEETKQALSRIIELKKEGAPILFSANAYKNSLNWPDFNKDIYYNEKPDFDHPKCLAGEYFCIIDYNGDVYPCPQLVGIFKPHNILREGFKKAMEHTSKHTCHACSMPCSNEFSMFFGLNPKVMFDQWKSNK